jgi:flagellar assembly protein FliH
MSDALSLVSRDHLPDVHPRPTPAPDPPEPRTAQRPTIAELEAIGDQARREGYEQGLAEGREAAREQLQRQLQEFRGLCDALARPLAEADAAVERQLAELAMLVARGVLQAELRLHPEHLLNVVRKAIGALPAATARVDIMVHPDSAALLRDGLAEAEDQGWRIVEDPQLKPGDCRIAGADSRIDGSIETRLSAMIDAALSDELPMPPGEESPPA